MGKYSKSQEKAGIIFQVGKGRQPSPVSDRDRVDNGQGLMEQTVFAFDPSTSQNGSGRWNDRLVQSANLSGEVAESFRLLRSKVLMPQDRRVQRTIMVTSVLPQEGKSFVTANLGVTIAQAVDQYCLLVDCDLRLPTLADLFGISSNRGLADYLKNKTDLSTLFCKTSMDKLSVLPSGISPVNPSELLGSGRMNELVGELSTRYSDRFVIFDSPPLKVASESMILAQAVDGVVLVVRQGISSRVLIEEAIENIGKEKIIGVVFNGYKSNIVSSRFINKSRSYYGSYYNKKQPGS